MKNNEIESHLAHMRAGNWYIIQLECIISQQVRKSPAMRMFSDHIPIALLTQALRMGLDIRASRPADRVQDAYALHFFHTLEQERDNQRELLQERKRRRYE